LSTAVKLDNRTHSRGHGTRAREGQAVHYRIAAPIVGNEGTGSWRAPLKTSVLQIYRIPIYDKFMVQSFRDAETETIFQQQPSKQFRPIEKIALRKLIHLNQAKSFEICGDPRQPA